MYRPLGRSRLAFRGAVSEGPGALGLLARWIDAHLDNWGDLPGVIQTWGQRAAGTLARLYVGKSTYRSGSCRAHVDDSGSTDPLNRLRTRLGMPPT